MIALGLACENVAMIVGQPWTGLWLIFWVITNVSTAFYDIEIGTSILTVPQATSMFLLTLSQRLAFTTSDMHGRSITLLREVARSYSTCIHA
jgi:hypothetical protein